MPSRLYEHRHWLYAWVPLFGAFIWSGTLLAMLITWLATGRPKYVTQEGNIAYISDIGAGYLKPLFIVCCCITGVSFFLTLVIERWLRNSGRLLPNMRRRERVFAALAVLGSFIGGAGLILLSIFDTGRHPSLHRVFLLVFIVGVALSAIFTIIEYRWISRDFVEVHKLKHAYIAKGIIAIILIILAIVFAITLYTTNDVAAVIEWVIAFGYTFFLLTFVYDLRMTRGVEKGQFSRDRLLAMRQSGESGPPMGQVGAGAGVGAAQYPYTQRDGYTTGNPNGYTNGDAYAGNTVLAQPANAHAGNQRGMV